MTGRFGVSFVVLGLAACGRPSAGRCAVVVRSRSDLRQADRQRESGATWETPTATASSDQLTKSDSARSGRAGGSAPAHLRGRSAATPIADTSQRDALPFPAPSDQVNEHSDQRQDDHGDRPSGLGPARDVVSERRRRPGSGSLSRPRPPMRRGSASSRRCRGRGTGCWYHHFIVLRSPPVRSKCRNRSSPLTIAAPVIQKGRGASPLRSITH